MTVIKAHRATIPIDPARAEYIGQWWLTLEPLKFRQGLEHAFLGLALSKDEYHVIDSEGAAWPLADVLKMKSSEIRDELKSIEADTAGPNATYERMKFAAAWAGYAMENFVYEMPAPGNVPLQDEHRSFFIDTERDVEESLWFHRGMASLRHHDRSEQNKSGELVFKAHVTLPHPSDESPARDEYWRALAEDRLRYRPERDKVFREIREDSELGQTGFEPADLSRPPHPDKIRGTFAVLQETESKRILGAPRQEYQPGSHKPAHNPARRERDGR